MNKKLIIAITISLTIILSFGGCKKGGLNIFTIEDDKTFGAQMETEIAANSTQYPLLNSNDYASSYAYLENLKQQILNGGQLNSNSNNQFLIHGSLFKSTVNV